MIHGVYYLIRAYFTENKDRSVGFPGMKEVPLKWSDAWFVPLAQPKLHAEQRQQLLERYASRFRAHGDADESMVHAGHEAD